jgi:hypothetical protein
LSGYNKNIHQVPMRNLLVSKTSRRNRKVVWKYEMDVRVVGCEERRWMYLLHHRFFGGFQYLSFCLPFFCCNNGDLEQPDFCYCFIKELYLLLLLLLLQSPSWCAECTYVCLKLCCYTVLFEFDVHVTVHRVKYLIIKPTRCTNFFNFSLKWNSTCVGHFFCPSSGVFTVHIVMIYVIQVCKTACKQAVLQTCMVLL